MKNFLNFIKEQAMQNPQKIVFPEGFEKRILQATETILEEKTAYPILVGDPDKITKTAKELNLKINWDKVPIINPKTDPKTEKYAEEFYNLRKNKGVTEEEAQKTIQKVNYFSTMMVQMDDADGMISGTTWSTADTIRPALQIIKTKEKFHKVSGFFFMVLEKRLLLFADCAVTIDPNSHDLKDIAIDTAETAKRFCIKPKIAMLSFSTNRSADHPLVDKVREATAMIKHERPDLIAEGEMQVDAALVPEVCERKFPDSKVRGDANILIFPDLQSANISYKLVERLGKAIAVGPVLQGLKKPVNDLSRGCSYEDIVDLAAITTIEAQEEHLVCPNYW